MTYNEFNHFCEAMTATSHVVQWGDSHVWKVGGKVFAIGGWGKLDGPAPYLATRGMKGIQQYDLGNDKLDELRYYISESDRIVASGLSKKKQNELGLVRCFHGIESAAN